MERLTYWNEEYGCWSYHCASGDAAKRLAEYEDAEEQGQLHIAPVPDGTIVSSRGLPLEIWSCNIDGFRIEHQWDSAKKFLEDWCGDDPSIGDNEILRVLLGDELIYCSLGNKDPIRTSEVADWFI